MMQCGEEEETVYYFLGKCNAMMMARYSILGSHLVEINELQRVQPPTRLRYARA